MSSKKSKALPIAAGLIVLLLLVGFVLGLRTVIEFNPVSAEIRTTRYIYYALPVSSKSERTWISPADVHPSASGWELMHSFDRSAAGSKIVHTRWGAIADTIEPWGGFILDGDTRAHLRDRAIALINSDRPVRAIRIYMLRIDTALNATLDDQSTPKPTPLSPAAIDEIFRAAIEEPIDD